MFVEDDFSFAFITTGSLELTGLYDIRTASNGKEGLEQYRAFQPDVIVSDIEMPTMDGFEMVKQIRKENEQVPILFATARTAAQDVLEGYKLHVDNFIKKPFLPEELNMHIQAILKRVRMSAPKSESSGVIAIGEYLFNVDSHKLQRKEELYKLTDRESQILERLYQNKGELVRREALLEELWGVNDFFTSRSLDVFVSSLRKYLANDSRIEIVTLRGKGLMLVEHR